MSGHESIPDIAPRRERRRWYASGRHAPRLLAAAGLCALAAGCASANAAVPAGHTAAAPSRPAAAPTASSMAMPAAAAGADGPSAAALMVCGSETAGNVTTALALPSAPKTTASWSDQLYTCTYRLPSGSLVLSVKDLSDTAAGNAYFQAAVRQRPTARPLTGALGLGDPGYETPQGAVIILKDAKTLLVDATSLPAASGPAKLSRSDLAYEIATDILGCWNGK